LATITITTIRNALPVTSCNCKERSSQIWYPTVILLTYCEV